MKSKRFLLLIPVLLISFLSLGITITQRAIDKEPEVKANNVKKDEQDVKETYCLGQVIKIISDNEEELPGGNKQRSQQLLIKIFSGSDKGKKRATLNLIPDNPAFAIVGEVGKKYLITKVENLETGNEEYFLIDYYREPFIWSLFGLFLIILIIIGGKKGIRTIISLFTTIAFIAFLLIPLIVRGANPLLAAVLVSFLSTAFTMVLVAGVNAKSLASTLGTVIGICLSGFIATYVIKAASLSGLASSEAMILWGNQLYKINFKGLLAAGMIVSCLGAIMDVAISVSSSIQEIKIANPKYSTSELFKSGMNVGKDIMGTMTTTLVLAYTGMALPLLLLISHEQNPSKFLNLELVMSEITAAIAGSIGLIISIPATAIIMSYLTNKKK
ncbi:MAG: YibE/F family protein [Candidatus Melainabacteria bacterium]|nr:YibE/F family protein [Candidatus Melainabacteria bacterium]